MTSDDRSDDERPDFDEVDEPRPPAKPERVHKVLAAAGVASRRACEDLIRQGRVTVDGEEAHVGMVIDPTAVDLRVDGERVNVNPDLVYLVLNKPRGVLTTVDDPEGRPTVMELVNIQQRLFPVGRLDMDTEGLLLMTNDGELANGLMHPRYGVERIYLAMVPGPVRRIVLSELREGVELEDGIARAKRIDVVEESKGNALLEIVMTEGRKREVRRMLDAVGLRCDRLARVSYGGVELGELRQGKWRFLTHREVGLLFAAIGAGELDPRRDRRRRTSKDERRRRGSRDGSA